MGPVPEVGDEVSQQAVLESSKLPPATRPGQQAADSPLRVWPFEEMATATADFAAGRKLGGGGFGPVYQGLLAGQDVAIKVLNQDHYKLATASEKRGLENMFEAEVRILARFRHPNLVRLLGYSRGKEGEGRLALVYELLLGGSLEKRLVVPAGKPGLAPLTLLQRYDDPQSISTSCSATLTLGVKRPY